MKKSKKIAILSKYQNPTILKLAQFPVEDSQGFSNLENLESVLLQPQFSQVYHIAPIQNKD